VPKGTFVNFIVGLSKGWHLKKGWGVRVGKKSCGSDSGPESEVEVEVEVEVDVRLKPMQINDVGITSSTNCLGEREAFVMRISAVTVNTWPERIRSFFGKVISRSTGSGSGCGCGSSSGTVWSGVAEIAMGRRRRNRIRIIIYGF